MDEEAIAALKQGWEDAKAVLLGELNAEKVENQRIAEELQSTRQQLDRMGMHLETVETELSHVKDRKSELEKQLQVCWSWVVEYLFHASWAFV